MEVIFGSKEFTPGSGSGGSDFNTPGSVEYQHLHSDGGGDGGLYPDVLMEYRNDGTRHKVAEGRRSPTDRSSGGEDRGSCGTVPPGVVNDVITQYPKNPDYRYQVINARDVPLRESGVTANYPIEICFDSDVGHTAYNGKQSPHNPYPTLTRTLTQSSPDPRILTQSSH